jgi:hypothetical protein
MVRWAQKLDISDNTITCDILNRKASKTMRPGIGFEVTGRNGEVRSVRVLKDMVAEVDGRLVATDPEKLRKLMREMKEARLKGGDPEANEFYASMARGIVLNSDGVLAQARKDGDTELVRVIEQSRKRYGLSNTLKS